MLKVTKDRSYREIEVLGDDDEELTEARARAFAEQYLHDEGSDDWDFDEVERINSQRVIVKFVWW